MDGPRAADSRGVTFHACALSVGIALALAVTWPLAGHVTDSFPTHDDPPTGGVSTKVPRDQLLISWILASNVRRLGEQPLGVFDTNNMHPFRHTLAYSENFLGITLPVWPVQAIWANPVLTHNVALLFTLALSSYGVILLVHELTCSVEAAVVAAVFATYSPFVWAQIVELHTVAGLSTALAFFALVRLVRTRAWRHALLLGGLAAWQLWVSLHWGIFLALGLASAVAVLLMTNADARRALPQLAAAGAFALLLIVPLVIPYGMVAREMDLRQRGLPMALFYPFKILPPVTAPLGYLAERIADGRRARAYMALAPWLAMEAGLLATILLRRPRMVPWSLVAAIAAAAIINFWYACGLQNFLGVPSLYALVSGVPGLGIVRAPARAVFFTSLMVAVLGGCGLAAVLRRVRSHAMTIAIAVCAVLVAVVETGWQGGGLVAAPPVGLPVPPVLANLPADCAVAEVPSNFDVQALALFRSTSHWRPLVNGRSGFYPVSVFTESGFLDGFPEQAALEYLRGAGACAVLVRLDDPNAIRMVRRSRNLGLQVFSLPPAYNAKLVVFGGAPPAPAQAPHLDRSGWRIVGPVPDARAPLDGSLDTLLTLDVKALGGPERLTIDLGDAALISGVDLSLGPHFRSYLWSYRIETSADGVAWSTIAEQRAAMPPLESYRTDPQRIVQRIRFPPRRTARFVRIGPYRRPPGGVQMDTGFSTWGVAEIDLVGRAVAAPGTGPLTSTGRAE